MTQILGYSPAPGNIAYPENLEVRESGDDDYRLPCLPWYTPVKLRAVVRVTLRRVKAEVPRVQNKLQLKLCNRETEFLIFRPIHALHAGRGVEPIQPGI